MRVELVAKQNVYSDTNELWHQKGDSYEFTFDSWIEGCDGYIVAMDGTQHWMELPSNSHNYLNESWHSADYFTEVVID